MTQQFYSQPYTQETPHHIFSCFIGQRKSHSQTQLQGDRKSTSYHMPRKKPQKYLAGHTNTLYILLFLPPNSFSPTEHTLLGRNKIHCHCHSSSPLSGMPRFSIRTDVTPLGPQPRETETQTTCLPIHSVQNGEKGRMEERGKSPDCDGHCRVSPPGHGLFLALTLICLLVGTLAIPATLLRGALHSPLPTLATSKQGVGTCM